MREVFKGVFFLRVKKKVAESSETELKARLVFAPNLIMNNLRIYNYFVCRGG